MATWISSTDGCQIGSLTVAENASVSLTLAELNDFAAAGLTPIEGGVATAAANTGGSITIVAEADGTLDLGLVEAGGSSAGENNGGTLTLQVDDTFSLSLENGPSVNAENLSVTGAGTLVVTEDLNLSGLNLNVGGDVTIELAATDTAQATVVSAEQADALAQDGVTIEKAAAGTGEAEGVLVALGGDNTTGSEPKDLSGLDLSLADVLGLEDPDGTILPDADALPDTIVSVFGSVLVDADTDLSTYKGTIESDVIVETDATLKLSAATADGFAGTGNSVDGADATVAGETGGSIVITGLETSVEYNLSGAFSAGGDGGVGDAGTFQVSIPSDVTLEAGTTLPTSADVTIDTGATLTVNGGTAQVDGTNDYQGTGTLDFIDLNGNPVTADKDVQGNTFTFDAANFDLDGTDAGTTITGFEAEVGNGSFIFDDTNQGSPILGSMSLDLTSFDTNGGDVITGTDAEVDAFGAADIADAGVIIISDAATLDGTDFGTAGGDADAIFFAVQSGGNTEVLSWVDDGAGTNDGIVDTVDETSLVATLNGTETQDLGSENFTTV